MIETKFRGKSDLTIEELEDLEIPHKNGWVIGNLIGDEKRPVIVGSIVDLNDEYFNTEWWVSVIPESIGQHTGYKDFWENDVCEDSSGNKFLICWSDEHCSWDYAYYLGDCRSYPLINFSRSHGPFKKIGNITDNPEMLLEDE